MVNSRKKGNLGERQVIKILSKYFPGKFERRSMGVAGSDIVCPDNFPFSIEVKNHKTVKALHLLLGTNSVVAKWWRQTCDQAKVAQKDPLLIVKVQGKWFATDLAPNLLHWYPLEQWCKHRI